MIRIFNSCSSCNRPSLPDWLIVCALVFMSLVAGLLGWLVISTVFS